MPSSPPPSPRRPGSLVEIFTLFLWLGMTSFGGPVAHLGYFHQALVVRRRWVSDAVYADLVALCQFLPGPASSKVGFILGLIRGNGLAGGVVAWIGFTLPSAVLMLLFAAGASALGGPVADGVIHGLKLVAVAVVGQALWGMAQTLTPDRTRLALALVALALTSLLPGVTGQISAIFAGLFGGWWLCRERGGSVPGQRLHLPIRKRAGAVALTLFALLFVLPALVGGGHPLAIVFEAFYRAGALVFGGGHVLLPLLQGEVVEPGWVGFEAFLAGYGAAQALPGPLFTFAAYLGAVMESPFSPMVMGSVALVAVFLPGVLLVYGLLPFWDLLRAAPATQALMRGANAAVVGILGAAFYQPLITEAILSPVDFVLAVTGLLLLTVWKWPPWRVVFLLALAGVAL